MPLNPTGGSTRGPNTPLRMGTDITGQYNAGLGEGRGSGPNRTRENSQKRIAAIKDAYRKKPK